MSDNYNSDNYIIEITPKSVRGTIQAGIVVRDGQGFRFFAATHAFDALEGQLFRNPKAAEHAALERAANIKFDNPFSPFRGTAYSG